MSVCFIWRIKERANNNASGIGSTSMRIFDNFLTHIYFAITFVNEYTHKFWGKISEQFSDDKSQNNK